MISYIFRRLLMMLVTLFGISIIIFAVINLMPGRPSIGSGQEGNQDVQSSDRELTSEADRKWRASFNLDKPLFLNTRPWLERADVQEQLELRVHGISQREIRSGVEKTDSQKLVSRMHAEWVLDDLGQQAVARLVEILEDESVPHDVRRMAGRRLPANIERRKVLPDPAWSADSERFRNLMAYNEEVTKEKHEAEKHSFKGNDDPSEDEFATEAAWWRSWFDERRERFVPASVIDKLGVLFFDTRYSHYMGNLITLEFGETMRKTRVIDEIVERLPLTVTLNAVGFFFIYLLALPIGIMAAVKRGGTFDVVSSALLFMLYSLPVFYVGLMMVRYMTGSDGAFHFPVGGWEGEDYEYATTVGRFLDRSWHSVLPVLCIVYGSLASLSRYARTGLLDIIESDYIRTARAKGLAEKVVILKHALRNGAMPVLTLLGTLLPQLIGGSVIIEVIFELRGMGKLMFDSILTQDFTIIVAIVMISSTLVVIGMFIVDLLYMVVDPRISLD